MQNPRYVKQCVADLAERFNDIEIIPGDRYYPVLAVRLNGVEPPETVLERKIDITIPMARCAGYIPGATLLGVHVHCALHGTLDGEKTMIPFCDPVEDDVWMKSVERFFPLYETGMPALLGSYYLCLNEPEGQPETPLDLIAVAFDYLAHWSEHVFSLAGHYGSIAKGVMPGDMEASVEWIEHIVENVAPGARQKLLAAAYS